MVKPMSFDDLIAEIYEIGRINEEDGAAHDIAGDIADFITSNRVALEAGCRRVLQCEVEEYKWDEKMSCAPQYDTFYQAYPLKTDGKYAGFWCYRADTAQKAKDKLRVKIESLGLTAVFVDDDGEETSDDN